MAVSFQRILRPGSTGDDVRQLQNALSRLGYNPGPADGIFGPRTQAAVLAFQRDYNLTPDGIVGPLTEAALNRALAARVPVLRPGSRGPEVSRLQSDLKRLGYDPGPVDGIYGPRTRAAVIAFQRDAGITADGIAGPQTRAALDRALRRLEITEGIIADAWSLIGIPYQWGGESPQEGFDCSGLVYYIYSKYGIKLPRVSRQQFEVGTPVSFNNLRPGDLVFFDMSGDGMVDHVGIYVGGNRFISATSTRGVVDYGFTPYWLEHYVGAKRVY